MPSCRGSYSPSGGALCTDMSSSRDEQCPIKAGYLTRQYVYIHCMYPYSRLRSNAVFQVKRLDSIVYSHFQLNNIFSSDFFSAAMFAGYNQENLVHAQQTAASRKPLSTGSKGLAARTPAQNPKTPFKSALNNENAIKTGGKSILKDAKKVPVGESSVGKNAFLTPARM
jgi:hypothetical protein